MNKVKRWNRLEKIFSVPLTCKKLLLFNIREVLPSCCKRVNIPRAECSLESSCCPSLRVNEEACVCPSPGGGWVAPPVRGSCFPAGTRPHSRHQAPVPDMLYESSGKLWTLLKASACLLMGVPGKHSQWVGSSLARGWGGCSEEPGYRNQWAAVGECGLWRTPAPPHRMALGPLLRALESPRSILNGGVVRESASHSPAEQLEPFKQTAFLPGNFILRIGSGI